MEKNKRVINILLIVIGILVVVGCVLGFVYFTKEKTKPIIDPEEKKAIQNQEKLFSLETYPRIDGSTVTLPLEEAFKADFTGTDIKDVDVTHSKTHNAYVNLINGDTDLILVTYPSDNEQKLAKEKGAYPAFKGSEWETGAYFTRRGYTSDRWKQLAADVAKYGIRNGYLMAVAPTGSTSNIANTTAGIDPIFKKFFIEEKKGSFTPKTAPDLNDKTFWLYKEAHTIDQQWSIKACGVRQRHIDQAQSFNLYITPQMKAKEILDLYVEAYKQGIKTIYYIRNQSLEMDECTSCSS